MFFQVFALLLCALPPSASGWSSTTPGSASPRTTYRRTDPDSGVTRTCDRCAPGTYLRAPCTDARKSACVACPPGSFTALWNHLEACLPCGACSDTQEVLALCSASRDSACRCAAGRRYVDEHEACVRHSTCPAGYGVAARGTPDADTRCQPCPPGSYSARDSAQDACLAHSGCATSGRLLAVPGRAWHDSVCATCHELTERDAAELLRGLLPGFFVHQNMPVTRLWRLLLHLLPGERVEGLGGEELHLLLSGWALRASPQELRRLRSTLRRAGAIGPALRLTRKLRTIQNRIRTLCTDHEEVQEERGGAERWR